MRALRGVGFIQSSFAGRVGMSEGSLCQLLGCQCERARPKVAGPAHHLLQRMRCSQAMTPVTPTAISGLKG